jgi:molybdenum cofactor cytidylyltransferase
MPFYKQKISLILLAAGNSSRLRGKSKQQLEFHGKTLLRRAAETAVAANFHSTVVILGADSGSMRREIEGLPVRIAINENWATGMSSSIKIGLAELVEEENLEAVVIMLCDQPLVTTKTLDNLCEVFAHTGKPIAACEYENTVGVPALFSSEVFAELLNLHESEGAKKIIEKYAGKTALVAAPEAALDIDMLKDYEKLKRSTFSV